MDQQCSTLVKHYQMFHLSATVPNLCPQPIPSLINRLIQAFIQNVAAGGCNKRAGGSPSLPLPSLPLPSLPFPSLLFPPPPLPSVRSRPPKIQLGGLGERCKRFGAF